MASYPVGESWPPAPDLRQAHRRTRRVRRWGAGAILATGIIDLLDSVTPPLRGRLHAVVQCLPLRARVAAGALVAMAQDQPGRGQVQAQPEEGGDQEHGREGRELQGLLDHERRHQDQDSAGDRQRQQHVEHERRDRQDQKDDDADDVVDDAGAGINTTHMA